MKARMEDIWKNGMLMSIMIRKGMRQSRTKLMRIMKDPTFFLLLISEKNIPKEIEGILPSLVLGVFPATVSGLSFLSRVLLRSFSAFSFTLFLPNVSFLSSGYTFFLLDVFFMGSPPSI